jgi:two-component system sensor kinase FixL
MNSRTYFSSFGLRSAARASQDRAFLSAVVNGSLDGILALNEGGTILSFNPAAAALFGYAPAEVIGRNFEILMPEPYRGGEGSLPTDYLRGSNADAAGAARHVEGQRKDGTVFPMLLTVSIAEAGRKRFFVGFVHDLTERCGFRTGAQDLREDRLKLAENIAAGLAHELNQPLSAINSYLDIARRLLKNKRETPVAKLQEVLDSATGQVSRAAQMISNLREYIARDKPGKSLQRLNDVVRTACEFTDPMARENKVAQTLRLDATDDRVLVNRIQIQQVVVNLKRNAIEAMKDCRKRELVVSTSSVYGSVIRVDVADSGPGLPEAVKKSLFQPFTTTKADGLGVGLSISWSIIEAHNGRLWAESNPGGGTIFSFVLKLAGPDGLMNEDRSFSFPPAAGA